MFVAVEEDIECEEDYSSVVDNAREHLISHGKL